MQSLPATIRVKLSSEDAGAISVSPVVVRDMPTSELVELMLGFTGKNVPRVQELLLRGTLVSGASRFRWTGWQADAEGIEQMMATFPDPEPARPLSATRTVRAVLRGSTARVEVTREAGARRKMFRRRSFWDGLVQAAGAAPAQYVGYSYRDRADVYKVPLSSELVASLRDAAGLLVYTTLTGQIRNAAFDSLELYVER